MKAKELCEDIHDFCRANTDEAIIKKYSRYFKEGYDAYGVSRETLEAKVKSLLKDERITMKFVLSARKQLIKNGKYENETIIRCRQGQVAPVAFGASCHGNRDLADFL